MKGILIDPTKREVREVEFGSLNDLRTLVGGYLEAAYQWMNGDTLFVDEEGLFKDDRQFFLIEVRADQLLAGNGVIVGRERDDDEAEAGYVNDPPTITLEAVRTIVYFTRKVKRP